MSDSTFELRPSRKNKQKSFQVYQNFFRNSFIVNFFCLFNPAEANIVFLHLLETLENQRFSNVLRGYIERECQTEINEFS